MLIVAAGTGDQALFQRFLAALSQRENGTARRGNIFSALGSFRDPEIERAASKLTLRPEFDYRESVLRVLGQLGAYGATLTPTQ